MNKRTSKREKTQEGRELEGKILREVARRWGRQVIHIWDRGLLAVRGQL